MNDALELSVLLQTIKNSQSPTANIALKLYAKADFLSHRRRFSESHRTYLNIYEKYPESPLSDNALMMAGKLSARMGRFEEAVQSYDRLLEIFPDSDLADEALILAGEVSEFGLMNPIAAIFYYENILIDYPRSLFSKTARKRLRRLTDSRQVN